MNTKLILTLAICGLMAQVGGCAGPEGDPENGQPLTLELVPLEDEFPVNDLVIEGDDELVEKGCLNRSDNPTNLMVTSGFWGSWSGCADRCPANSFAYAVSVKSEHSQGSGDDTAANGVRLHCYNRYSATYTGYIDANVGPWGTWSNKKFCSTAHVNYPIRIGRGKLEGKQGSGDDTALNNVAGYCGSGLFGAVPAVNTSWGTWQTSSYCPSGKAVCGLRTRVEGRQGSGDDTALNGVLFECCDF